MTLSPSLSRVSLFALALGLSGATAAFAQTAPTTPSTGGKHHHQDHKSPLTADEKAQLKQAKNEALAADPSLATEKASLKQKKQALKAQGASVSKADRKALHTAKHEYKAKLRAEELKLNPALAPIFAKLDADKHHHHHEHHSTT